MSALDGTYWRVKWFTEHNGVWWRSSRYQSRGEALEAVINKLRGGHQRHNVKIVRIRPRVSIVKAVRLLTEARAKEVELCMVRVDQRSRLVYLQSSNLDGKRSERHFDQDDIAARWIVATPEDARSRAVKAAVRNRKGERIESNRCALFKR